ncbi:MAG: PrsW family glutamic-type intramembrane protease [Synergistota bacterium]|nr:PrsW family glutamic-type intramembrane protease [Synergistota bacterium]
MTPLASGWIVAMALAPGLGLLWWFYHKDKMEPEPYILVAGAFFRGMFFVIPAGLIEELTGPLFGENIFLYSFVGIAMVEEGLKWFALRRYIAHPECDECYDGIVYGTSVALGFATLENLMYVVGAANPLLIAGWRAVLAVPLHALCGLAMGYEAGRQKQVYGKVISLTRILALPVFAHGLYDLMLLMNDGIGIVTAIVVVVLMWRSGFKKIRLSRLCP